MTLHLDGHMRIKRLSWHLFKVPAHTTLRGVSDLGCGKSNTDTGWHQFISLCNRFRNKLFLGTGVVRCAISDETFETPDQNMLNIPKRSRKLCHLLIELTELNTNITVLT